MTEEKLDYILDKVRVTINSIVLNEREENPNENELERLESKLNQLILEGLECSEGTGE